MPKFAISTETSDGRVRVIVREATTRNQVFAFWATEDNARQFERAADEIRYSTRREQAQQMPPCRVPAVSYG